MLSRVFGPLARQLLGSPGYTKQVLPNTFVVAQQLRGYEPGPNQSKLWLGNLPWSLTDDDLKREFSKYGEVYDVFILRERGTNRSRGMAFVTIDANQAESAVKDMNGLELQGRQIKVAMSTSTGEPGSSDGTRPRSGGYGGGGRYNSRPDYGGGGRGYGADRDRPQRDGYGGDRDRPRRDGYGGYRDRPQRDDQ